MLRILTLQKVKDFLYPKGSWDGWAKFYSPHCSSKVGDLIIKYSRDIILRQNEDSINSLIFILSNPTIKPVYENRKGKPNVILHQAVCKPTKDARKLIQLLRHLQNGFNHA